MMARRALLCFVVSLGLSVPLCRVASGGGDFVYRPELAVNGPLVDTLRWAVSLEPQIASNSQQSAEIDLIGGSLEYTEKTE